MLRGSAKTARTRTINPVVLLGGPMAVTYSVLRDRSCEKGGQRGSGEDAWASAYVHAYGCQGKGILKRKKN